MMKAIRAPSKTFAKRFCVIALILLLLGGLVYGYTYYTIEYPGILYEDGTAYPATLVYRGQRWDWLFMNTHPLARILKEGEDPADDEAGMTLSMERVSPQIDHYAMALHAEGWYTLHIGDQYENKYVCMFFDMEKEKVCVMRHYSRNSAPRLVFRSDTANWDFVRRMQYQHSRFPDDLNQWWYNKEWIPVS